MLIFCNSHTASLLFIDKVVQVIRGCQKRFLRLLENGGSEFINCVCVGGGEGREGARRGVKSYNPAAMAG